MNKKILLFCILTFSIFVVFGLGGCKKDKPDDTPKPPEVKVTPEQADTPQPADEPKKTVEPEVTTPDVDKSKNPDPKAVEDMLKKAAPDNPELAELVAKMFAEAEKNRTVQTTCPVLGNPIKKEIFVDYQGKRVFFCCPECKEKFIADPQKYLPKLPQFKK